MGFNHLCLGGGRAVGRVCVQESLGGSDPRCLLNSLGEDPGP